MKRLFATFAFLLALSAFVPYRAVGWGAVCNTDGSPFANYLPDLVSLGLYPNNAYLGADRGVTGGCSWKLLPFGENVYLTPKSEFTASRVVAYSFWYKTNANQNITIGLLANDEQGNSYDIFLDFPLTATGGSFAEAQFLWDGGQTVDLTGGGLSFHLLDSSSVVFIDDIQVTNFEPATGTPTLTPSPTLTGTPTPQPGCDYPFSLTWDWATEESKLDWQEVHRTLIQADAWIPGPFAAYFNTSTSTVPNRHYAYILISRADIGLQLGVSSSAQLEVTEVGYGGYSNHDGGGSVYYQFSIDSDWQSSPTSNPPPLNFSEAVFPTTVIDQYFDIFKYRVADAYSLDKIDSLYIQGCSDEPVSVAGTPTATGTSTGTATSTSTSTALPFPTATSSPIIPTVGPTATTIPGSGGTPLPSGTPFTGFGFLPGVLGTAVNAHDAVSTPPAGGADLADGMLFYAAVFSYTTPLTFVFIFLLVLIAYLMVQRALQNITNENK